MGQGHHEGFVIELEVVASVGSNLAHRQHSFGGDVGEAGQSGLGGGQFARKILAQHVGAGEAVGDETGAHVRGIAAVLHRLAGGLDEGVPVPVGKVHHGVFTDLGEHHQGAVRFNANRVAQNVLPPFPSDAEGKDRADVGKHGTVPQFRRTGSDLIKKEVAGGFPVEFQDHVGTGAGSHIGPAHPSPAMPYLHRG